jgi:hypothetical protein
MPRIAKWSEKLNCVKHLTPKPVKFIFEDSVIIEKVYVDFQDFIDQAIQQSIKQVLQYDQFVSIKEVPNG